jgi:cellulose 1,4-beta-cellobiosidase
MDRIEAIDPPADRGMGLAEHLDACLAQGANLFTLMIYDLPHRDCSASASNGELECDAAGNGIARYKTDFVDPIIRILDDPKYWGIRIICLLETDSLPNLVTNVDSYQKCREVQERGCYVKGIQYCLDKLYPLTHTYKYLEISHSAWLGWPDNFNKAITLYQDTVRNTANGTKSIDGFADNVCNTLPLDEPFISSGDITIGGQQVKNSKFYDFNSMVDELQYCDAWVNAMRGTFPNMGMIVDTARNGWGGPNRPTRASTSTDVNIFVDQSRVDRRSHRGNWCNNKYAGIGERPQANPRTNYHAYIWVKPPGESDGVSQDGIIDPQDPNKKFDKMCDPTGLNTYCNCGTTDALSDMPHAGRFSTKLFQQLLTNAYPPL